MPPDGLAAHYNDVIMGAIASQITSLTIVYSTVYSDADQRKHQKLCVTGLCAGNSPGAGEFPAQMASNAENVSIWWRHHGQVSGVSVMTKFGCHIYTKLDLKRSRALWITVWSSGVTNPFAKAHFVAQWISFVVAYFGETIPLQTEYLRVEGHLDGLTLWETSNAIANVWLPQTCTEPSM